MMTERRRNGRFKIVRSLGKNIENSVENKDSSLALADKKTVSLDHTYIYHESAICSKSNSVICVHDNIGANVELDNVHGEKSFIEGNRIVDLGFMIDTLNHGCSCGNELYLKDCVGETIYGLGSYLNIKCSGTSCDKIVKITTSRKHGKVFDINTRFASGVAQALLELHMTFWDIQADKGMGVHKDVIWGSRPCQLEGLYKRREVYTYELNTLSKLGHDQGQTEVICDMYRFALVQGMLDAGIGERKANNLISSLNIPVPSKRTLKRREREVGIAIEKAADDSIKKARVVEKEETAKRYGTDAELKCAVDAGWQNRGSGRSYNSLTGHLSVVGDLSGKIVDFEVRSRKCRKCDTAAKYGIDIPSHQCRKNFNGTSKAMEPHMVVKSLQKCKQDNFNIKTLVGDSDTTTMAKVRQEVDSSIDKCQDLNHLKKNLGNQLYKLKDQCKNLTTKTIKYIQKNFVYMLKNCTKEEKEIKRGLSALSCHPFGDHTHCDPSWCRFIKNGHNVKFRSLPYGKPLTDELLRKHLDRIFETYQQKAAHLLKLGSTQANESFNMTVASKAPKSAFYGGSDSINFRVASAVLQKNEGKTYIASVHNNLSISPGKFTIQRRQALDKQHYARKQKANLKESKRRRLELKDIRSNQKQEIREGKCYQTEIEITDEPDIEHIPDPIIQPSAKKIDYHGKDLIFFDLETTGLGPDSDIIQISAVGPNGIFERYVKPNKRISDQACQVTGITYENGQMFHKGKKVPSVNIKEALTDFIMYLNNKPVMLIAHNAKNFDSRIFYNSVRSCRLLNIFQSSIHGFIDTLPMMRVIKKEKPHNLSALYEHFFLEKFEAHNATEDVIALKRIYEAKSIDAKPFTFSWSYIAESLSYIKNTNENMITWQPVISSKAISKSMAKKASASGLKLCHVQKALERDESNGVQIIFSEKNALQKVRVTQNKRIIESVSEFLKNEP